MGYSDFDWNSPFFWGEVTPQYFVVFFKGISNIEQGMSNVEVLACLI